MVRQSRSTMRLADFNDSDVVVSPIKRLVLYQSNSEDFTSPLKETCANDSDAGVTPLPRRRYGALQYAFSVPSTTTCSSPASCGEISIPPLERDTPIRVMHKDSSSLMLCNLNLGLCLIGVELEGHPYLAKGGPIDWLPSKMKECGHIVGISVDNSCVGWNNLVASVIRGRYELDFRPVILLSIMTMAGAILLGYSAISRGGRGLRGTYQVVNENFVLKCSWLGGCRS
ncbi:hypothetical protein AAC387_Pa02g2536 [Persea americana]